MMQQTVLPRDMTRLVMPASAQDHILGSPDADIELVEYGDFECPYCTDARFVVRDILQHFEMKIPFAYRHFPLREIHFLSGVRSGVGGTPTFLINGEHAMTASTLFM